MKTAYDLDGTLILSPFNHWFTKKFFWAPNQKVYKHDVETIITARTKNWAELTWITCKIIGLNNVSTIIFNPKPIWDHIYISSWKYSVLDNFGFDAYIDNNSNILSTIRNLGFKGVLKNV